MLFLAIGIVIAVVCTLVVVSGLFVIKMAVDILTNRKDDFK